MQLELLVSNLSPSIRRVTRDGRKYLVADATLIVPGVLNGSRGRLYYPPDEVSRDLTQWDKTPMVAYHPQVNGQHVSVRTPGIIEASGLGFIERNRYEDKHKSELWFDEEYTGNYDKKLKPEHRIVPRLLAGKPIELSTGLYTDNIQGRGVSPDGREYDAVARNYRPDHLAILPDQVGACSVEAGCGVNVNSNVGGGEPQHDGINTLLRRIVNAVTNVFCATGEGGGIDPSCGGGSGNSGSDKKTPEKIHKDIRDAVMKLGGSSRRINIADLRDELGEKYEHEKVTEALWKLAETGDLTLMRLDNPREIKDRDNYFPVRTSTGEQKHIFYWDGKGQMFTDNSMTLNYRERVEQVLISNLRLDDLIECQDECDDDPDCVDDCLDELGVNAFATGVHGNPQSAETGKFKPLGSGTGAGEVHDAAQRGNMVWSERDRELGAQDPATWAMDDETLVKARAAASKGYDDGDAAYGTVVAHIYQKMGGSVKGTEINNQENTVAATTRDKIIEHLTTNCDCWKGGKDVLANMTNERLAKIVEDFNKKQQALAVVNAAQKSGLTVNGAGLLVKNAACDPAEEAAEGEVDEEGNPVAAAPEKKKKEPPMVNKQNLTPEQVENLETAARITQNAKRAIVRQLVANVRDPEKQKRLIANLQKKPLTELEDLLELQGPRRTDNAEEDATSWFFGGAGGAPVHNRRVSEGDAAALDADAEEMMPATLNYGEMVKENRAAG